MLQNGKEVNKEEKKMSKCMKKIVVVLLSLCMFFPMENVRANETTYEMNLWSDVGEYPITPQDNEWIELTYAQQLDTLSMPDEILKEYSSKELAKWVLNYPFLIDVLAFDNAESAINYLSRTSNICKKFLSSDEAIQVLLDEYNKLKVNYSLLLDDSKVENVFNESGYSKEIFLQTFFAYAYNSMNDTEKDQLDNILLSKYKEKEGICEEYTTALLFIDRIQQLNGEITIQDTEFFNYVSKNSCDQISVLASNGFVSNGSVIYGNNGALYYNGTYTKYGVAAPCYKYSSGDYSSAEQKEADKAFEEVHPAWTRIHSATKKYNCHSYAWIQQSASNIYWMDSPDTFLSSSSVSFVSSNGAANTSDKIVIRDSNGTAQHSCIAASTGSNINSIKTTSKCGNFGVYDAPLVDMVILYGNSYKVYR